jgi:hypothetical protein
MIFTAFSSRSAPIIRPEFPAIFEADIGDPPLRQWLVFAAMQGKAVRFTDLRYFVSQLHHAFFDRLLHDDRLAPQKADRGQRIGPCSDKCCREGGTWFSVAAKYAWFGAW